MQHCSTFAFASQANTRKLFSFMLWSFWKRILPTISWLKIKSGLLESVATGIQQSLSCITECIHRMQLCKVINTFISILFCSSHHVSIFGIYRMLSDNTSTRVEVSKSCFPHQVLAILAQRSVSNHPVKTFILQAYVNFNLQQLIFQVNRKYFYRMVKMHILEVAWRLLDISTLTCLRNTWGHFKVEGLDFWKVISILRKQAYTSLKWGLVTLCGTSGIWVWSCCFTDLIRFLTNQSWSWGFICYFWLLIAKSLGISKLLTIYVLRPSISHPSSSNVLLKGLNMPYTLDWTFGSGAQCNLFWISCL